MNYQFSTRLRPPQSVPDYNDQAIIHHIEIVEQRIRMMCRVSQVFINQAVYSDNAMDDCDDLQAWGQIFYEFVDQQMNELEKLRRALENGLFWVSITGLREGEDFRTDLRPHDIGEGTK